MGKGKKSVKPWNGINFASVGVLILIVGVVIALIVAVAKGQGFIFKQAGNELIVTPPPVPVAPPVAETNGPGSLVAAEGGKVESKTTLERNSTAVKNTLNPNQSSAKYVTHGAGSSIAVGPNSEAKSTVIQK